MGGTMANVVHSFHDPIFQIHHVQVDRVFTLWQQARKCADGHGSSECYRPGVTDPGVNANLPGAQQNRAPDGQLRFALVGAMFNDAMYPWNVALNEALVADQGYTYLAPGQAPPETKTDVDEEDGGEDAQDPNGSGRAQDPVKQDESTKRGDAAVVRHEVSGVLLCAIAIALTW